MPREVKRDNNAAAQPQVPRGTVVAAGPPHQADSAPRYSPVGLVAVAGALSDFEELDDLVSEVYAERDAAVDRVAPRLQ